MKRVRNSATARLRWQGERERAGIDLRMELGANPREMKMATAKRVLAILSAALSVYFCAGQSAGGQEPLKIDPHIHVAVDLVQLNVAVTDNKGNYITGLRPGDFTILEDGIAQKAATFAEGNEPARKLGETEKSDTKDTGE